MNDRVKTYYRGITPPQNLKEKCLSVKRKSFPAKRVAAIAACSAVLLFGGFGVNAYLTPAVSASPISFARAETVVSLNVKTHLPVVVSVQEGLLSVDGVVWEKSLSLSSPAVVGWSMEDGVFSSTLVLEKQSGKQIVYELSHSELSGWELKK